MITQTGTHMTKIQQKNYNGTVTSEMRYSSTFGFGLANLAGDFRKKRWDCWSWFFTDAFPVAQTNSIKTLKENLVSE